VLREQVLPALRITQRDLAARLRVSPVTIGALLQERRSLSTELAARIAKLLGHSAERWIRMQIAVDLWRIARDPKRLAGIEPLPRRVMEA
jgi:addiction module HigA family antidote